MAAVPVAPEPPYPEADGAGFDRWLTSRSFSMLPPLCRMGLAVVLAMLLLVDPLLHHAGVWGAHPQHPALVAWHFCASLHFLGFSIAARRALDHRARARILVAFFPLNAVLFCWFGFISWMLSGDLSTYAIFLLTLACVFPYPGHLRTLLNLASAITLVLLIHVFDARGTFHTSGAAINLLALHVVALLINRHLMRLNLALYQEKRRVEYERGRADSVLYNALPMAIADELKRRNVVPAERHDRMVVLFADIVGFTQFCATRPADRVVQVLNDIFSGFDNLVDRHEAEKIKTIGDAYMVVGKGGATDVAELALEMIDSLEAYNRRSGHTLAIRCGMHVGPAVTGVIGHKRFLYDVWGDACNTASRMEALGAPGKVHVSEEVYLELTDGFRFEPRGVMEVRGKGSLRTYFLLGPASPAQAPLPAAAGAPARRLTPSGATTSEGGSSGTPSDRPVCAGCAR